MLGWVRNRLRNPQKFPGGSVQASKLSVRGPSGGSTRNMSFKLLRQSSEKKGSQITFLLTLSQLARLHKDDGREPKAQGGGSESCGRGLVAVAGAGHSYL
jgi:hypothetical protein